MTGALDILEFWFAMPPFPSSPFCFMPHVYMSKANNLISRITNDRKGTWFVKKSLFQQFHRLSLGTQLKYGRKMCI